MTQAEWFRDLDSNQDTQLQRLMSYRLDDPGMVADARLTSCRKERTRVKLGASKNIFAPARCRD